MRYPLTATVLACCMSPAATADAAPRGDSAKECERIEARIEKIHADMRAGYGARKGQRLAKRLRELQKKRAKLCR
ncbi:MAG: hypothetical protein U5K76_08360 [Woeseiaceae bacterium]|nr:hypothetical protein [Woeseiaceae bacterium]